MGQQPSRAREVPLALKIVSTLFVALLVPVYWYYYGIQHFLWISDVALFITLVALWRESRLLISMMAIGVLPLELVWLADFLVLVVAGIELLGVTAYMFDEQLPLLLRVLSLFHVPLLIVWVWLLRKWGYDPRALRLQTALFVVVILLTYVSNINWVHTPAQHDLEWMPELGWVALYLLGVPVLVHWPLHVFYRSRLSQGTSGSRSARSP
jgi:hypothetical protein